MLLISNNRYRLGRVSGSGTRPRMDDGQLRIAAMGSPTHRGWGGCCLGGLGASGRRATSRSAPRSRCRWVSTARLRSWPRHFGFGRCPRRCASASRRHTPVRRRPQRCPTAPGSSSERFSRWPPDAREPTHRPNGRPLAFGLARSRRHDPRQSRLGRSRPGRVCVPGDRLARQRGRWRSARIGGPR